MFALSLLAFLAAAHVIYYALAQGLRFLHRRRLIAQNGCQNVNRLPCLDPLFGLDVLLRFSEEIRLQSHLPNSRRRFVEHGNTHVVRLGVCKTVFTCEPENIKAVLATQFENFGYGSRRKLALRRLLGPGIFSSDGEQWKHSRQLLRPTFAKDNISNVEFFECHVQNLFSAIEAEQLRSAEVDLQHLFNCFTLDTATEIFLGQSCYGLREKDRCKATNDFGAAFDRSQQRVTRNFVLGPLGWAFSWGKQEMLDTKVMHDFLDRHIQRVLAAKQKLYLDDQKKVEIATVTLEDLAEHTSDPHVLRGEILNLLAAARGTTSSLLSSLWFNLARHPTVLADLRHEVQSLSGQYPDFTRLKSMNYLQACLQETLRLHPPIPINTRTAKTDTVFPTGGGPDGTAPILITAGASVAYNVYALHRRLDIWGLDAEEFRPGRWEGRKISWEWIPFNGGPRLCLGQQFALMTAGYVTVRLVQAYLNVQACEPEEEWRGGIGFAVTIPDGVRVRLGA